MNKTMRIKLIIDNSMTVLMLFAMAYQLTGNMAHEVIGANIFIPKLKPLLMYVVTSPNDVLTPV